MDSQMYWNEKNKVEEGKRCIGENIRIKKLLYENLALACPVAQTNIMSRNYLMKRRHTIEEGLLGRMVVEGWERWMRLKVTTVYYVH